MKRHYNISIMAGLLLAAQAISPASAAGLDNGAYTVFFG